MLNVFSAMFDRLQKWRAGTTQEPAPAEKTAHGQKSSASLAEQREPESRNEISRMAEKMLDDPQFAFALRVLVANCNAIRVTWTPTVEGNQRADDLAEHTDKLWRRTRRDLGELIKHGRVAYEKVHKYNKATQNLEIRKLVPLPYDETEMQLDESGNFSGIELSGGKQPVELEAWKSYWTALDATPTRPHGRSRFLGAPHEVFKERREVRELRKEFLRRFSMGLAKAHVNPTGKDPQTGQPFNNMERVGREWENARAGGIFVMSNKPGPSGAGFAEDIEMFPEPKGSGPLDATLDTLAVDVLRSLGMPEKTIMEGSAVGSYALVTQQMLILNSVCEEIVEQDSENFQEYVADKQAEDNFPESEGVEIQGNFLRLSEAPTGLVAELVQSLLSHPELVGAILQGLVDIPALLESAGIPVTPQAEQVLERVAASLAAMRAGAAQQQEGGSQPARPFPLSADLANTGEKVPTVEGLGEAAQQRLAAILGRVKTRVAELARQGLPQREVVNDLEILDALAELELLLRDVRIGARILGMVSIWSPGVSPNPNPELLPGGYTVDIPGQTEAVEVIDLSQPLTWSNERRGGEVMMEVNLPQLMSLFKQSNPEFYVERGGPNEIAGRVAGFDEFIRSNPATDVIASEVYLVDPSTGRSVGADHDGPVKVEFSNGRHRVAWMLEQGMQSARIRVPTDQVPVFRRVFSGTTRPVLAPSLPEGFQFPALEKAHRFLEQKGVLPSDDGESLTEQERRSRVQITTNTNLREWDVEEVRNQMAKAIEEGEAEQSFVERVNYWAEAKESELRTQFRTHTKTAYLQGKEATLETPALKEAFPYVLFVATRDNRVRPHHWALNGKLFKRGSRAHNLALKILGEYNCRCDLIQISEQMRERRGLSVTDYADLPIEVKQQVE